MNDPRENCPWKCKHCLCYEGEIKRLSAEGKIIREALEAIAGCSIEALVDRGAYVHVIANKALDSIQADKVRWEYEQGLDGPEHERD